MTKEILLQIHVKKKESLNEVWFQVSELMALPSGAADLYKGFLRKQSLLTFVDLQCCDHVSHGGSRHSSTHRTCSATPGQTHGFALTKSMGRVIQNLPRTVQLARFSCLFWWMERKRGCWAKSPTSFREFAATGASGVGAVVVGQSVAHYRFMDCNTNEVTVLNCLTLWLKQAAGLLKIFANTNLFFPQNEKP